jgi:cytochrome c heme-lyase
VRLHFLDPELLFESYLSRYTPPFDRHDWIVDRCGTRVRYVIDFYTGRSSQSGVSFYLDARPALDNWEGVKMRAQGWMDEVVQTARAVFTSAPQPPMPQPPSKPAS